MANIKNFPVIVDRSNTSGEFVVVYDICVGKFIHVLPFSS